MTDKGLMPFNKVRSMFSKHVMKFKDVEVYVPDKKKRMVVKDVPEFWSDTAVRIAAGKYFYRNIEGAKDEDSILHMFYRVSRFIAENAYKNGIIKDQDTFMMNLIDLQLRQVFAFNSPVYFNVGVRGNPQSSACFILGVNDDMESLLNLQKYEALIFKYGSGAGANFSRLRSKKERIRGGGYSSGPVSFMKALDGWANIVKSGGVTRRAAKMAILNADHPDVMEFIWSKAIEERKAAALVREGFGGGVDGEAYRTVAFQNQNNSVRATDEFMNAVIYGEKHKLKMVNEDGYEEIDAREVMNAIAKATWECGDPGMQFHDTVNKWNPVIEYDEIVGSNPCSEFMFLDFTACNLASINLMHFYKMSVEQQESTVSEIITAMETLVGASSYPNREIEKNSHDFRPLGIGFTNLGAVLMKEAIPYDSEEARAFAANMMARISGFAYLKSAKIAEKIGPFSMWEDTKKGFINVLKMHREYTEKGSIERGIWDKVVEYAKRHGVRNAQISVIAPTGTISLMMDCATTGIEPEFSLVKYKNYVGGTGVEKFVNPYVEHGLKKLGYSDDQIKEVVDYIVTNGMIEGAPHVSDKHYWAFVTAVKTENGTLALSPKAHIDMMAAVQPFVSGAISKTVNVPNDATVEEIRDLYIYAWQSGLKAVAIYRDGSKNFQVLETGKDEKKEKENDAHHPVRRKFDKVRYGKTVKVSMSGFDGYFTINYFDDGSPGELFIEIANNGSTLQGLLHALAIAVSIGLQYGVPMKTFIDKYKDLHFEPSGATGDPDVPFAKSLISYIFSWIEKHGMQKDPNPMSDGKQFVVDLSQSDFAINLEGKNGNGNGAKVIGTGAHAVNVEVVETSTVIGDVCHCGGIMMRTGTCYTCTSCGETTGCA